MTTASHIDSDRDDISYDDSREAQISRVVDRIARHVLDDLGWSEGNEELGIPAAFQPGRPQIEAAVYAPRGGPGLAIAVAKGLLWPGYDQDTNREQPIDLHVAVIDRAAHLAD